MISGRFAEALGLLTRISFVADSHKLQLEFPDMAQTTGTVPGKYAIRLKDGTVGVIHPSRRQPA